MIIKVSSDILKEKLKYVELHAYLMDHIDITKSGIKFVYNDKSETYIECKVLSDLESPVQFNKLHWIRLIEVLHMMDDQPVKLQFDDRSMIIRSAISL